MEKVIRSFKLPDEICSHIYEYYKLPFKDEIHPWMKYSLKDEYYDDYTEKFGTRQGNYYYDTYKLYNDYVRTTIFGDQRLDPKEKNADISFGMCKGWYERNTLKELCRLNGIIITEKTHTKTLFKRLMKL